jgi:hypothetical protein
MANEECRNDIVITRPDMWPRSCLRCGHGPCTNLANKEAHLKYDPIDDEPTLYKHADEQRPTDQQPTPQELRMLTESEINECVVASLTGETRVWELLQRKCAEVWGLLPPTDAAPTEQPMLLSSPLSSQSTARPPRLQPGRLIGALEHQIAALRASAPGDAGYAEATWKIMALEEQIAAVKHRPDQFELIGWGGEWLGVVRSWIQSNFRNGDDVVWGGHDPLHTTSALTADRLERLGAEIASAAIREHMGTYVHRVKKVNGHGPTPLRKKNHYDWLDAHFVEFLRSVFAATPSRAKLPGDDGAASYKGLISAHGDKCYSYRQVWAANSIPFPHGVAVYLLSYIAPWSVTCRQVGDQFIVPVQWVVFNYEALKAHLPPVSAEYS